MKIPIATYRLQFCSAFDFHSACEMLDYLPLLGISDIYASPIFKAKRNSTHGYDVIDPLQINPEIGGAEGFDKINGLAKQLGLGWLQDIVPNHMAFDTENLWLMDVLENGVRSKYYKFFDIEWDHPFENLRGRVLAPFLGRFYAEALHNGEINLTYSAKGFSINYYDLSFPIRLSSYSKVLRHNLDQLRNALGRDSAEWRRFEELLYSVESLSDPKEFHFQYEHIHRFKEALWEMFQQDARVKTFIKDNLRFFNGTTGVEESFNSLDSLISEQGFRLSFWKVAIGEINYRRFFNINDMISLNMDDNDVFHYTHELIFKLAKEGKLTGLRIDHVDGLYDPQRYLDKLRENLPEAYLVVEKILESEEELRDAWPVEGTTGYDYLNYVNGLFCQKEHEKNLIKTYYKFTGLHTPYEDLVHANKLLAVRSMGGTIDNLARLMKNIAGSDRYGRDITFFELKRALVEFMVNFPVYRTYINREKVTTSDEVYIHEALERSRKIMPGLTYELNFIEKFFFPDPARISEDRNRENRDFALKLQQYTGPLMAKGFEDTVLYVYNKLISLNEVGGDPQKFGVTLKEFHAFNQQRLKKTPLTMNATSTHDTKRGEDVRARINVLSEIPGEWKKSARYWNRINLIHRTYDGDRIMPDENDEYALYQTLIGSFPADQDMETYRGRLRAWMIKAVREAKVHTEWIKPDGRYEESCIKFIEGILQPAENNLFLADFKRFQKKIAFYGMFNSLSQTLIKLTSPGIPDIYQGCELWDLSLVDPDNRRVIDFGLRKKLLKDIASRSQSPESLSELITEILHTREDGRIKMFLTWQTLKARKQYSQLFQKGTYRPLKSGGMHKEKIVAFSRKKDAHCVVVCPRFLTGLVKEDTLPMGPDVWQDTYVSLTHSQKSWTNILTGEDIKGESRLPIGSLLKKFPVALLISK